jgi:hypothetical protein
MQLDFVGRNLQGSRQLLIGFSPGLWVSGIDRYSFFSTLDTIQQVNRSDSRWLNFFAFIGKITNILSFSSTKPRASDIQSGSSCAHCRNLK